MKPESAPTWPTLGPSPSPDARKPACPRDRRASSFRLAHCRPRAPEAPSCAFLRPQRADAEVPRGRALRTDRGGLDGGRPAPAWAAEVVSSNIVGYNKIELGTTFTIVAAQFNSVGGETKDVQEFVNSDATLVGLDENFAFQTELRVWGGLSYDTYGYDLEGDPNVAGSDHKWVDGDLNVVSFDLPVGSAVWIKTPDTTKTVTLSGEVPEGDTVEVPLRAGFNLVANPFPVATKIQDIQLSDDISGLNEDFSFKTEIRIWGGLSYDTYGWDKEGDPEVAGTDHKWVDGDLNIVDVTIPVGHGFWIKTSEAGKVTFKK